MSCIVLPSMHQAKALARREARSVTEEQHRQRGRVSRQAAWYGRATTHQPLRPPQQLTRAEEVWLHRLRLGYPTLAEMRDGFEGRQCEHCDQLTRRPLPHYMLSCPATAQLRLHHHERPQDEEAAAALLVQHAQRDLHSLLQNVREAPPTM